MAWRRYVLPCGIVESVNKSEAHPNLFMLQEQRRMHADISKFTNSFIYKNRVYDHPSVSERKELAKLQPFANEASVLFDTSQMGLFVKRRCFRISF